MIARHHQYYVVGSVYTEDCFLVKRRNLMDDDANVTTIFRAATRHEANELADVLNTETELAYTFGVYDGDGEPR